MRVLVTGGAGYLGALVVEDLLERGHDVSVLDSLIHGQLEVADALSSGGARVVDGDVRDSAARAEGLDGAEAVVHLAAIVGDPACARDPELAEEVNVDATHALVDDTRQRGVERLVFASTCSNYGRMADRAVPIDEAGELAPVSLYAEQKVDIERRLLGQVNGSLAPTCLRFATIYGAAPRMRFDLTVNEFTRELWAGRQLEVFGELFWRPYIHVRDAAQVICGVLGRPLEQVRGEVFNVGRSDENYRKLDLVELITNRLGRGEVTFVSRTEDPRDYKVSFEKLVDRLGLRPALRVTDGIDEIVTALEQERFGDPFSPSHSNLTSARLADVSSS
jgi:nucleoside-diphosphate-sugar epimerase